MHRTSYWLTVIAALIGALGGVLGARLGHPLPPSYAFLINTPLYLLVALCVTVALGGAVCLWRDSREIAGKPDLYAALIFRPPHRDLFTRLRLRWLLGDRLRPGDAVLVKSYGEIAQTLDAAGNRESLPFMEEMKSFCGKSFQVYRRVDKINDMRNKTGLRRMRNTVTLTEQRCSGRFHDGCQAGCQILWKEAWLTRLGHAHPVLSPSETPSLNAPPADADVGPITHERVYNCQMTSLWEASQPMSKYDIRQDLRPLLYGNIGLGAFVVALLTRLFNRVQGLRGGAGYPAMPSSSTVRETPSSDLRLKPGEAVVVCSKADIARTLFESRNRGLWFDREQIRYCGQSATVSRRVNRVVHESTRKMISMKTPCVILQETVATGEFLRCCAQHEHIFWREVWLARPNGPMP